VLGLRRGRDGAGRGGAGRGGAGDRKGGRRGREAANNGGGRKGLRAPDRVRLDRAKAVRPERRPRRVGRRDRQAGRRAGVLRQRLHCQDTRAACRLRESVRERRRRRAVGPQRL